MDSFILVLRVSLSLGAVLAVLWLAHRYARRSRGAGSQDKLLTVVARQGVGQKASVVIVDSDGKRFLLGVTDQSVTMLHATEAPAPAPSQSAEAFSRALSSAGKHRSAPAPVAGFPLSPAALKQALNPGTGGRRT